MPAQPQRGPCFWQYAHIAEVLLRQAGDLTAHRYGRRISTYADPGFQESTTRRGRLLTDHAANTAEPNSGP
jgi:thiaminase/transcriptional activator TenA